MLTNCTEYYTGMSGNIFKECVRNHKYDFNNINQKSSTTLSKHIWNLKETKKPYDLLWSIVKGEH